MKTRNAKTLVISLALMLVMCVAATLLSFSLADDTPGADDTGSGSSFNTTKTNIDYIIENSASSEKDETGRDLSPFYIVEIGSAANDNNSPLKAMVVEDLTSDASTDDISHFVKQVINGWSTENKTMTPNKISYQYIPVGTLSSEENLNAAISAVSKADLIYVSNDPDSQYSASKDIPEDLKMILSGAATSNYTPFIIDSPTKTSGGGGGGGSSSTITTLAQKIFAKSGVYRAVYSYDVSASTDATKFLNRLDKKSKWLPISGDNYADNWIEDVDGKKSARILTIQRDDSDNAVTAKLVTTLGTTTYDMAKIVEKDPTFDPTGKEAYQITGTAFEEFGYRSTQAVPDNVILEKLKAADLTADLDLSVYDMIIVEAGTSSQVISADVMNMMSGLVFGMQTIVYDNSLKSGSGEGEEQGDIITSPALNYQYVVNKVADANEIARFSNVLVTGMAEMRIYGAASAPSGVKPIADIINNGSYRNSGGGGSSSNLYTVLEVQPCYPIDLDLAKALQSRGMRSLADKPRRSQPDNGTDNRDIFYYVKTDGVLNDTTSDEISYDGGLTSLSDMESTDDATTGISSRGAVQHANLITTDTVVDYYAWELSKAKVAYLTGLPYNKVNVVHMSSVEFNTSRETLLDNYDAIYIGGKNTAIKDVEYILKQGREGNAAVYNMYFHNGGTYSIDGKYGVLTGNDITYNKFVELQKYIAAGMPVIFTKAVTEAYFEAKINGYNTTKMDPESNVFKLMDHVMNATTTGTDDRTGQLNYPTKFTNVLAGFDPTDQVKVQNDGSYGLTYSGYVTIFGGIETQVYVKGADEVNVPTVVTPSTAAVNAEEFTYLLANSNERPKFSLLQGPALYVEGDASTEITTNQISFKFDVASKASYTVKVYVDNNTNSRFEDDEVIYGPKKDPSGKITASIASSFDGALYWKFEITSGDCKSSVVGLSKVKVKAPNYVSVLQITPDIAAKPSDNSKTMLLFCTECQQAKGILKGNRYNDTGKYSTEVQTTGRFNDQNGSSYNPGGTVPDPSAKDPGYTNGSKNWALGTHTHNFGIVKYDGTHKVGNVTGSDDWTTNWCYDLLNDYTMDIDLWTTSQFDDNINDAMTKVTAANYTTVIEDYKTLASIYKTYYMTMRSIIDGTVDTSNPNYTYLKNKLTKTNNTFVEADVNTFFGEDYSVYNLESAKGGFGISEAEFDSYRVAQKNIDAYLTAISEMRNKPRIGNTSEQDLLDEIRYEKTYHRYSDFYSLSNAHSDTSEAVSYVKATATGTGTTQATVNANRNVYTEFNTLFVPWRNAKIFEQYFYKMYMKYLLYASVKEYDGKYVPDLTEVFSCIVIGVAENFGNDDIDSQNAIDTLKAYIENDGNTFIFHQTINDSGNTKNLTNNLRTLFGQNYNHISTKTVTETALTYEVKTANTWEKDSAATLCEGTLEEGQGLDINLVETANGEIVPEEATATANATGNINIRWTINGNGNWSNKRVWIYINGSDTEKYTFICGDHSASTGVLNNVARITERAVTTTRVVNEYPTDTNRYHYTAMMKNGKSLTVTPYHRTMTQTAQVRGNHGADGRYMYTQTGLLQTDVEVPEEHVAENSDDFITKTFTTAATQTNEGVVTLYPFLIGSRLKISGTHPNCFSTDIENDDVVVYYAMAGGEQGTQSSVCAADPQDGIDNYFLYSYGNVTYCGAGHSLITGFHRDNNDERRLFINVILNSAKKSVFGPTIDVYDPYPEKNPDGTVKTDEEGNPIYTNNDITKAEDGSYEMVVPSTDSVPEFTYKVTIPDIADEVSHVMIYYDLSSNTSDGEYGFVSGTDVKIFESDAKTDDSILKNKYKLISEAIDALKLKPEYFRPYDNKYTYIVIAVKTKKGTVAMQRIMVKIAPKLWDMT